jgi:hypothetical protein
MNLSETRATHDLVNEAAMEDVRIDASRLTRSSTAPSAMPTACEATN